MQRLRWARLRWRSHRERSVKAVVTLGRKLPRSFQRNRAALLLLFLTGLTTMGMEVIWIRLFTPYVGPVVYAFATILAVYLFATFLGSRIYREWSRPRSTRESTGLGCTGAVGNACAGDFRRQAGAGFLDASAFRGHALRWSDGLSDSDAGGSLVGEEIPIAPARHMESTWSAVLSGRC